MPMTLKAARVNCNIQQKDAAQAIGVTVDTLRNWEAGRTFPDVPRIKKIEELYGVPYSELIFCVETSV